MSSLLPSTQARLKQLDPDRYRAALAAEAALRDNLLLLYAFHVELAKIPQVTTEPALSDIRYQWWREVIEEIYTGQTVRRHEITTPLAVLLRAGSISRFSVDRLIDGRARDLDPRPFADMAEAEQYCADTSGQLMGLAVDISGGEVSEAVRAGGLAWGLLGLARGYSDYNETVLSALEFEQICAAAQRHYETARTGLTDLSAESFPAIAYAALIPKFLKKLRATGPSGPINFGPISKQITLYKALARGRI